MTNRYVKKPIEIEAMKLEQSITSQQAIIDWGQGDIQKGMDGSVRVKTSEGIMVGVTGDYIIKEPFDKDRKFYPCKPDIFELTYDKTSTK